MAKIKIEIDTDKITNTLGKTAKGIGKGASAAGSAISKASKAAAEQVADKGGKAKAVVADKGGKAIDAVEDRVPVVAELRERVSEKLESNAEKFNAVNNNLQLACDEYNEVYSELNQHGEALFDQRQASIKTLVDIESLINSIANTPKSFEKDIQDIQISRDDFKSVYELAAKEVEINIEAGRNVGAGVAGGAAFAAAAPATAMWVATTFGTASTGVAISSLSGAAATNAALAWLGGGALAAGGGGMALGESFLLLAGPVGAGIAGVAAVTSVGLMIKKRLELATDKKKETERILANTQMLRKADVDVVALLDRTSVHHEKLINQYNMCKESAGSDYKSLPEEDKMRLGALINNALSLATSLSENIGE